MHELISSFLSNESPFGRFMTKAGIIIGANLMFILLSLPLVTAGACYGALYHVMFRTLRGDGVLNPFKQFWIGFKSNFKRATIVWLIFLVLAGVCSVNLQICQQAGGVISYFRYGIYAILVIAVITVIYFFPTAAAFDDSIPALIRNGLYFAFHKPLILLVNLFFHVFPLYLTYTDPHMRPLYAFLWFVFGFGAVTMLTARLLLPDFARYLPIVDDYGDFILTPDGKKIMPGSPEEKAYYESGEASSEQGTMTEEEILREMEKMGM